MTTSGSTSWTENQSQIITRALRQCSAIDQNDVATGNMLSTGGEALNALVKQLEAQGIHLWTETEGVLFPQPNQPIYQLGPGSPDHATTNWILTSLVNSYTAGTTNIQITYPFVQTFGMQFTGFSGGDYVGIVLANGTVFWTTITSVSLKDLANPYLAADASGDAVYSGDPYNPLIYVVPPVNLPIYTMNFILNNPLPSPANAGAFVFDYTTPIDRPLRVINSRRFLLQSTPTTLIDTPMLNYSRLDYREMPNKYTTGTPTAFFYDPQLGLGIYNLWPNPLDVSAVFRFTWFRPIQDFVNSTDTPDLPTYWNNFLSWNLAKELAPEYDVPMPKWQQIVAMADQTLDIVTGFDREPESTYFGVAFTPSSR